MLFYVEYDDYHGGDGGGGSCECSYGAWISMIVVWGQNKVYLRESQVYVKTLFVSVHL